MNDLLQQRFDRHDSLQHFNIGTEFRFHVKLHISRSDLFTKYSNKIALL